MNITKKYHYFYKITNLVNGHFYYGVHNTDDLNDGYMGSGKKLHIAYKKYGIENFSKEILRFFDTAKEAFEYESEIVNESLVIDDNCYNLQCGGTGFNTLNTIVVIDITTGNKLRCTKDDPKYINKQYVPITTNHTLGIDNKGNTHYVEVSDNRFLSGELKHINCGKGRILVNGKSKFVDKTSEEYIKNEKFNMMKSKVLVKTKNGDKSFVVDKNDPRYLSGELIYFWKGNKFSDESKNRMKETFKNIKHQQGEKNSQYGKIWIYNETEKISKRIKKSSLDNYIKLGWKKGRKIKFFS